MVSPLVKNLPIIFSLIGNLLVLFFHIIFRYITVVKSKRFFSCILIYRKLLDYFLIFMRNIFPFFFFLVFLILDIIFFLYLYLNFLILVLLKYSIRDFLNFLVLLVFIKYFFILMFFLKI